MRTGMIQYNQISLDYDTREELFKIIDFGNAYAEMTYFDSAFLCGIIRKIRPKKIVEVGVAAGGTTAIIISCLESMYRDYELYSVDLYENWYNDKSVKCGDLGNKAAEYYDTNTFHLLLGKPITEWLDYIGDDIDLVILDTSHQVPGEILDFITLFPHLRKDAMVVLHDFMTSQYSVFYSNNSVSFMYGNTALFNALAGNKYINFIPEEQREISNRVIPDIVAIEMTDSTKESLISVVSTLILPWGDYMPWGCLLDLYTNCIHKQYAEEKELIRIYDEAIRLNILNYGILMNRISWTQNMKFSILLYGAGMRGKRIYKRLKGLGTSSMIKYWIDKRAGEIEPIDDMKIERIGDVDCSKCDYAIITPQNTDCIKECYDELIKCGFDEKRILIYKAEER